MSIINLTVVAPVFNEAEVISIFNARLLLVLEQIKSVNYRILYVVDKCTDNSLEILIDLASKNSHISVIALSSRFGHQASLLAGIEHSLNSDAIIMMDSDLQHPPELIPRMIEEYKAGFEVVYTNRESTEDVGFLRKSLGNLFYKSLSKLADFQVNPNAADFRLISNRVATVLSEQFQERKLFLRGLFSWMGFNAIGVNYIAKKREAGASKYSLEKMIELAVIAVLSFSIKPLRMGIFLGLGSAISSFFLMIYLLSGYFFNQNAPSGWMTLIIVLLFFGGILLIVIGIIGAYVGGIYEEVKGRPRYLINQVYSSEDFSNRKL